MYFVVLWKKSYKYVWKTKLGNFGRRAGLSFLEIFLITPFTTVLTNT